MLIQLQKPYKISQLYTKAPGRFFKNPTRIT